MTILTLEQYKSATKLCERLLNNNSTVRPSDASVLGFPIEYEALARGQLVSKQVRRTDHLHHKRRDELVRQWKSGDGAEDRITLLKMARHEHHPPCLLARIVLEGIFQAIPNPDESKPVQLAKSAMRDPGILENERLRRDVEECIIADMDYSRPMDAVRRNVGLEYEYYLQRCYTNLFSDFNPPITGLRARRVPFENERILRGRGSYKTPDTRLIIPVAMQRPSGALHVVNWIESKAMFGDVRTFQKHYAEQLVCYVNRFGPGAVIYWYGYVDVLNLPECPQYSPDVLVIEDLTGSMVVPGDDDA